MLHHMLIRVAHLEDELDIHEIIHELCPEFQIQYKALTTIQQFEDFLNSDEQVDAILLDYMIQAKSSFSYIERIKQNKKAKFIFALSGHLLEESRSKAFQAGADYFIEKPYDIYELLNKIKDLFSGDGKVVSGIKKNGNALLLSRDPSKCQAVVGHLQSKSYHVASFRSLSSFESAISKLQPQILVIANNVSSLLKDRLANYLNSKYTIPVLVFAEEEQDIKFELERMLVLQSESNESDAELVSADKKIWKKFENIFQQKSPTIDVDKKNQCFTSYNFCLQSDNKHLVYKFCAQDSTKESSAELVELVRDVIYSELDRGFYLAEAEIRVLSKYYQKAQAEQTRVFAGVYQDSEIMVSGHIGSINPFQCIWSESLGSFKVPIEEWLTWARLNFPLYLDLEKSKGKVVYVNAGDNISQDQYQRLREKEAHLLVDASDFESYSLARQILGG